jgi:hypothetical protein
VISAVLDIERLFDQGGAFIESRLQQDNQGQQCNHAQMGSKNQIKLLRYQQAVHLLKTQSP